MFGTNRLNNSNYEYEIAKLKAEKAKLLREAQKHKGIKAKIETIKGLKREAQILREQGTFKGDVRAGLNTARDYAGRFVKNTAKEFKLAPRATFRETIRKGYGDFRSTSMGISSNVNKELKETIRANSKSKQPSFFNPGGFSFNNNVGSKKKKYRNPDIFFW